MDGTNSQFDPIAAEVSALSIDSVDQAIAAARAIKNAIVGNPTKKRQYLQYGVAERLITCTSLAKSEPILAEHAVAALGSLASYIPASDVSQVSASLLQCLFSPHTRPVYAAARSLKLFVSSASSKSGAQSSEIVLSDLINRPNIAARLVSLLAVPDEGVAEVCAVIIGSTTKALEHAEVYNAAGAIPAIVHLLTRTVHERCVEACINALSALARHSVAVARSLATPHAIVPMLLPFTRTAIHSLRLSACRLLTIFQGTSRLPVGLDVSVTTALVSLLTLCSREQLPITAQTLAELVTASPHLQSVATKAGAVVKLANILVPNDVALSSTGKKLYADKLLSTEHDKRNDALFDMNNSAMGIQDDSIGLVNSSPYLRASILKALAALSDDFDSARDAIISQNVLPAITDGLADNDFQIVQASVECVRSLSRSVKILRRDIARESIGGRILSLLTCENKDIQRCASATLCNLVLEFSPVRKTIIEKGGTTVMINLLWSEDDEVRKNCLWALKNLVFKADLEMKNAVLSNLKYDCLRTLFGDDKPIIRELAMTVVRNLACSPSPDKHFEQLDALFASTGERIISLLSEALKCDSTNIEMVVQALYVVCNIASGTEQHKAYLLESDIPQLILQWTSHEDERARIAAVWCTINLSWKERAVIPKRQARAMRRALRAVGRGSSSVGRLDTLRRQHLPLPSSPQRRRILERYETPEHGGSESSDGIPNVWAEHSRVTSAMEVEMAPSANDGVIVNAIATVSTSESNSDGGVSGGGDGDGGGAGGQNQQERQETDDCPRSGDDDDVGDSKAGCGYEWRIERLRQLGFERRLRSLVNDPHIEVQGRARAALELFNCDDVRPLNYDPSALLDTGSPLLSQHAPRAPQTSPVNVIMH